MTRREGERKKVFEIFTKKDPPISLTCYTEREETPSIENLAGKVTREL